MLLHTVVIKKALQSCSQAEKSKGYTGGLGNKSSFNSRHSGNRTDGEQRKKTNDR